MTVLATAVGNDFSHISYLLFCPETREAAAIDPFHLDLTTGLAASHGLEITTIVNTHEHWDHAGRNEQFRAVTGARVLAPRAAAGVIERIDVMLADGDEIEIGSLRLEVVDTPGHTMAHICLRGEDEVGPYLIAGDTMFGTIDKLCGRLPEETRVFPGHDYLARNLEFTLRHEPQNREAALLLEESRHGVRFTTLGEERMVNLFLRLDEPGLRETLARGGHAADDASQEDIFLALRRLRDSW